MEKRKRDGIVDIVIGSLMTAFFLFGLGIVWLIPALIVNPAEIIRIIRRFSVGEIVLLGFVVFLFFLGLFTIYRGISVLTGSRFLEAVRAFFHQAKGLAGNAGPPASRADETGDNGTKGESRRE